MLSIGAQALGHELRERGLVALAVAVAADRTSTLPVGLTRTSADSHKPTPQPASRPPGSAMPQPRYRWRSQAAQLPWRSDSRALGVPEIDQFQRLLDEAS
jgi:hypothetical protein